MPPIEQFVRKLIYLDLCKKNVDSIHKLLRKLDWNNKEVRLSLISCLHGSHAPNDIN